MDIVSLIPFVLLILIIILISQLRKPNKMMKSKKVTIRINRRTHFKLLFSFIGLLLVLTVTVELMGFWKKSATPMPNADPSFEEMAYSIGSQIMNREKVDPTFLFEKRTHPAGETLTIHRNDEEHYGTSIYIERRSDNDKTIEEFLYRPLLFVDGYDFSQAVNVARPIWAVGSMTIPEPLKSDFTYVSFHEAAFLSQLTKNKSNDISGFGSSSSSPIIHLKIPKDLKIIDTREDELIFIDEID